MSTSRLWLWSLSDGHMAPLCAALHVPYSLFPRFGSCVTMELLDGSDLGLQQHGILVIWGICGIAFPSMPHIVRMRSVFRKMMLSMRSSTLSPIGFPSTSIHSTPAGMEKVDISGNDVGHPMLCEKETVSRFRRTRP